MNVLKNILMLFENDDFKGIAAMDAGDMVRDAIKGLKQDRFEIPPGFSSTLKYMSRVVPSLC